MLGTRRRSFLLVLVALCGLRIGLAQVVLETHELRLAIDRNGICRSLLARARSEEYAWLEEPGPAFSVRRGAKRWPASSVERVGDTLVVRFQGAEAEVTLKVIEAEDYAALSVIGLEGEPVDAIDLLQLRVKPLPYLGSWIDVAYDDEFAVCLCGGTVTTKAKLSPPHGRRRYVVMAASAHRVPGIAGATAVLFGCRRPKATFLDTMAVVEGDFGLPRGAEYRKSPVMGYSYLWVRPSPGDIDEYIRWAKRGGFRMLLFSYTAFSKGVGHFEWNASYPNGMEDLKRVASAVRAAGLAVGLHIHYNKAYKSDPYVTPVPDERLHVVRRFSLASAVGGTAGEMTVNENPSGCTRDAGRRILRVGTELAAYESYTTAPPFRFVGLERGALKTRASAHGAGTEVALLDVDTWPNFIRFDQGTDIQDEVAERIARIAAETGPYDMVYFDGAEDVHEPFWYHCANAQWRVYRRLEPAPTVCEAAANTHFSWHMITRSNAYDSVAPAEMKAFCRSAPCAAAPRRALDFTRINFGWLHGFGKSREHSITPDTLEYVLSRGAAWGCPFSLSIDLDALRRNPRTRSCFDVIHIWEDARIEGKLTDAQRKQLENLEQEHHLFINERGMYELAAIRAVDGVAGGDVVRAYTFARESNPQDTFVLLWARDDDVELTLSVRADRVSARRPFRKVVPVRAGPGTATVRVSERMYLAFPRTDRSRVEEILKAARSAPCEPAAGFIEEIFREGFEGRVASPPLRHIWGDGPAAVEENGVEAGAGVGGSAGARLRITFPGQVAHRLSYWSYGLGEPLPLVRELQVVSFRVKTNVPVSIKIGIRPFGFIYHGPGVDAGAGWQEVRLADAYRKLKAWCERGKRRPEDGWVDRIIIAVHDRAGTAADIVVDDVTVGGPAGAREAVRRETLSRRVRRIRIAPISLIWDHGHRTPERVLAALDEAGIMGADLACLPELCVDRAPEPIPGPTSEAIAERAGRYGMYVVGNLRECDGDGTYVTSFLCDRRGTIVGRYRKSHCMPYESGFRLGDELPVFETDFGAIGLTIGTDHYFPEIDGVLRKRGASLIVWSTAPFPVRDEHLVSLRVRGRAVQHGLYYAVARYAGRRGYGGYKDRFSWTATWPLGRAQVFDPDGHTVADSGHGGGVALAAVPAGRLGGSPQKGGYPTEGPFALITASELPPPFRRAGGKRRIRAAVIECEPSIDRLIAKLDACGERGCDIACLWEYVWYRNDEEAERFRERNRGYLRRIAEAARRNRLYVLVAGELERGFNEAVLFDRQGAEVARYTKINQTTPKKSRFYRAGGQVGIFDLDFGRVGVKICADVYSPEIDRVAALHGVDLMLFPTQDAGPYTEHTRLRDARRCVDNGYFLLRAASQTGQTDHRTYIMDPWGMVLASSQFHTDNGPIVADLHLDNRPKYCHWPEEARSGEPQDPYRRGLRPVAERDLRAVMLARRRPELYRP